MSPPLEESEMKKARIKKTTIPKIIKLKGTF